MFASVPHRPYNLKGLSFTQFVHTISNALHACLAPYPIYRASSIAFAIATRGRHVFSVHIVMRAMRADMSLCGCYYLITCVWPCLFKSFACAACRKAKGTGEDGNGEDSSYDIHPRKQQSKDSTIRISRQVGVGNSNFRTKHQVGIQAV